LHLELLPQIVGLVATVFSVSCVLMRCDRRLRLVAATGQATWTLHFWLLAAPTTAAMAALTCARQLTSLGTGDWSPGRRRALALAFYASFTLATALTWQGWTSLLPWACSLLANYSYSSLSGVSMRKTLRGCDAIAFANGCVVGSIGALVTSTVAIVLNTLTIRRLEPRATTEAASPQSAARV
jgi:hypothetical protein